MSEILAKKESLTVQAAWILIAKIASYALTIAIPLILARRFNQTEFGLYKQVFLVITTANAILPFGFGMSAYYFLPRETGARRSAAVTNILLFNLAVGLLAFLTLLFFPDVLTLVFKEAAFVNFARWLGLAILLWIFSTFLETLVIANQEPRLAMLFIVFAQFTKAVFFVTAAVFVGSVESLIWAAIGQAALQSVVLFVYANKRFPGFWRIFDSKLFREQLSYTLPFGLSGWFYTMQTDLHNYFVASGFAAAEFAVYAVGCFELPLIGILAESVSAVLIPLMSRLQASDDKREIIATTARAARKLALVYFPLYAFLLVVADTFIATLFTNKFAASVPIFRLNLTLLPFAILALDPITRAYKEIGYFLLKMRVVLFVLMTTGLWFATATGDLLTINAVVVGFALAERIFSSAKIFGTIGVKREDSRLLTPISKIALATVFAGIATFVFHLLTKNVLLAFFQQTVLAMLSLIAAPKLAGLLSGGLFLLICAIVLTILYVAALIFLNVVEPAERQKLFGVLKKRFRVQTIEKPASA